MIRVPAYDERRPVRAINPDDFLETPEGRVWTPERSLEARAQSYRLLEQVLTHQPGIQRVILVCGLQGAGKSSWIAAQPQRKDAVYFDAALPGIRHRKTIIDIARAHTIPIDAVWIKTPLAIALDRNARRDSGKRVSDAAIRSVARQFEPPMEAEGFEHILILSSFHPEEG